MDHSKSGLLDAILKKSPDFKWSISLDHFIYKHKISYKLTISMYNYLESGQKLLTQATPKSTPC